MKPYQKIPIQDCGEPLVTIPRSGALGEASYFRVVHPHPYQVLGAPYGNQSPYRVRSGVLAALTQAQELLQQHHPHWGLQIFDAYRPLVVQKFMVEYTFQQLLRERQLGAQELSAEQHREIMDLVEQFWALPSDRPETPPPHSTGAAIDLTLVDGSGTPMPMGSAIDEISPRSFPDHFSHSDHPQAQQFHAHRQLLNHVMTAVGFRRHPQEWWHFSLGDQLWAWLINQETGIGASQAHYGRVD
jgi:D-alanyl-D-alanine dipeptidase